MQKEQAVPARLLKQFREIYSLPPNDLHAEPLTALYKRATRPLKRIPLLYIVPLSVLVVIIMYYLVGTVLVQLTSLLQYGF